MDSLINKFKTNVSIVMHSVNIKFDLRYLHENKNITLKH